jgi:integrase
LKPFKNVDSSRLRYLTKDEAGRLVNAAQGTFRDLVKAGLYTGCRYGELGRLHCGDFNPDSGTVFIGQSKSGKARHVVLTARARDSFPLCAGRPADSSMLTRETGQPWGQSDHILLTTRALAAANITGASFHTLRHTSASQMVMAGVPLTIVAQNLGHADARMTEHHYLHLAPSYVAETIRKVTPDYGLGEDSNLVPMRSAKP